jgi:hypothetical protein
VVARVTASIASARPLNKILTKGGHPWLAGGPVTSGIWGKIGSAMSKPRLQERLHSNRARRRIEVAPPRFVVMTDQQSEQAVRAVAAVLLPMIREWQRSGHQTQEEDSPTDRRADHRNRSAGSYPSTPPR